GAAAEFHFQVGGVLGDEGELVAFAAHQVELQPLVVVLVDVVAVVGGKGRGGGEGGQHAGGDQVGKHLSHLSVSSSFEMTRFSLTVEAGIPGVEGSLGG